MTRRVAFITVFLACTLGGRSNAQERLAISGYVALGSLQLAADRTFDAVSGGHRASIVGGGAHVSNVWRRLFIDIGASAISKSGERVSLIDGEVVPLGLPLEVRMRYLDLVTGWRHAFGRLSPFMGAGVSWVRYIESDATEPIDLVVTRTCPLIVTGLDISITRWVRFGAEVRSRSVRGVLGKTGASAHFGEHSAGGVSVAMRLAIGH